MKMKKLMTAAMTVAAIAVLAACGKSSSTKKSNEPIKIGLLQLINQDALDAARKGFIAELAKEGYKDGKNIKIDYVNANGDQSNLKTMSDRLARDKNVLNMAIATPAAQALQKADAKTPLLFTAITDPVSAGLATSMTKTDKNATGVTDMNDVDAQIAMIHKAFPKAKTVGFAYNAAEPNSVVQIKTARAAAKKLGLKVVEKTVATTNDVEQTLTSLAGQVDAIYIPTDNTLTAAMATVGKVSTATKVPVIPATGPMVKLGGVATRGIDYYDLGVQTAKMAVKIIKGKKVSDMPVEKPGKSTLFTNAKFMKLFKLTKSDL